MAKEKLQFFLEKYRYPLTMAVGIRILLGIWLAFVAIGFAPYKEGGVKTAVNILSADTLEYALLDIWVKWDGANYVNLIEFGYTEEFPGHTNYGPLYPFGTQLIDRAFFNEPIFSALLISFLVAIAFFVIFYGYIIDVFDDEGLAKEAIWLILFYPVSFFFFAPFSDGLYTLLALLFFIALRNERWITSGIWALLAGLARTQGALLVLPLIYELYRKKKDVFPGRTLPALLALILAPLGVIGFALYKINLGYPSPFEGQFQYNYVLVVDPITGYFLAIRQFLETKRMLVFSEIFSITFFAGILIWMTTKKRFRNEVSLLIYGGANLLLFLSKYASKASALQSSNRYVLSLFPIFIGMAALVNQFSQPKKNIVHLLFFVMLLVISAVYAVGFFVG